jgi:serine/threonine protein kinase
MVGPGSRVPEAGLPVRPGDVIADKYRVDGLLGRGGMGVVVSAEHLLLRTRVAVKMLLPDAIGDAQLTERFLREARATAALKSEHVVHVYDVGRLPSGAPYIVMELLLGTDLRQLVRDRGPLSPTDAAEYVAQAAAGLDVAHRAGILHRDVKSSNLLLTTTAEGRPLVKVLDFGLSKLRQDAPAPEGSLTATNLFCGSPQYAAPEQLRGLKNATERSEIWALGIVLYELLVGTRPFDSPDGLADVVARVLTDPPVPIQLLRKDVPSELAAIVTACLQKDPSRRPASASELRRRLAAFGHGSAALGPSAPAASAPQLAPNAAPPKGWQSTVRMTPDSAKTAVLVPVREAPPLAAAAGPDGTARPTARDAASTAFSPPRRALWIGVLIAALAGAVALFVWSIRGELTSPSSATTTSSAAPDASTARVETLPTPPPSAAPPKDAPSAAIPSSSPPRAPSPPVTAASGPARAPLPPAATPSTRPSAPSPAAAPTPAPAPSPLPKPEDRF